MILNQTKKYLNHNVIGRFCIVHQNICRKMLYPTVLSFQQPHVNERHHPKLLTSTEIDSQSSSSSSPSSQPNSFESPRIAGRLFDSSSGAFSPKPASSPSTRRSNSSLGSQHLNGQRTPTKMQLHAQKRMLEREESDLDMTITATAPIVIDDDSDVEEEEQIQRPRHIIQQQSVDSEIVEEVS